MTSFAADDVTISWVAPDNGGSPITSYRVILRTSDGVTFLEQTLYCDASDP